MSAASGTAGLAACQPASLRVTINANAAGGAAGSTYYPVNFTNTSGSACGMYGYPGVSLVTAGDSAARQIGAAAQRNPAFGQQPVRLAAGGVAHAWLQVAEGGKSTTKWEDLPPVSAVNPIRAVKPGATVLLSGTDNRKQEQVVLASQRYGRGKALAMPIQDSFLWYMNPKLPVSDNEGK